MIDGLFWRLDADRRASDSFATFGRIVDAPIVAARSSATLPDKEAIKDGRTRRLAEQADLTGAKGSRCALDAQIHQGQAQ